MLHPERDARTLRLNGDTGLIKVVACLCMLSDHLGKMIFPNALYISVSGPWAFLHARARQRRPFCCFSRSSPIRFRCSHSAARRWPAS